MVKQTRYLFLIILVLLNPLIAAAAVPDLLQHSPTPECQALDCPMAESGCCGDECFRATANCCNVFASPGLTVSSGFAASQSVLSVQNSVRDNYLSVVPPPFYRPPRQADLRCSVLCLGST